MHVVVMHDVFSTSCWKMQYRCTSALIVLCQCSVLYLSTFFDHVL